MSLAIRVYGARVSLSTRLNQRGRDEYSNELQRTDEAGIPRVAGRAVASRKIYAFRARPTVFARVRSAIIKI